MESSEIQKNIAKTKPTAGKGFMREGNTQDTYEGQHALSGAARPGGEFFDAFWSPFGLLLAPFGSLCAPFFGSLLAPVGSLLAPAGSLFVPF